MIQQEVSKALDMRQGKDLITAVHEVKEQFNLSDQEFYPLFMVWYNSQ